ncbi:MAG: leucine-rich repeat domain-containing protein [Chitinophagales bacterium]
MKKCFYQFLSLCFLSIILSSPKQIYAQVDTSSLNNEQQEIHQAFTEFFLAVEQKNNEKLLDMTYPKLFELVPKEQLLGAINEINRDSTINILIHNSVIEEVSESMEIDRAKYAIITYSFEMTMSFNDLEEENDEENSFEEEGFDVLTITYEMLSVSYGKENMTLDKENNSLYIKQLHNRAFAIKAANSTSWTFLENKANTNRFLDKLLPPKVLEVAKPTPKACTKCSSFSDALVQPELVTSLIMNPNLNTPNLESIPSSIGELVNLEILYLTEHTLNEVPKEIGNLKKLKELSLAGCQLEALPDEIFTLQNLDELLLFDNQFSKKYLKKLKKSFKKAMPKTTVFLNSDDFFSSLEKE